MTEKLCTPIIQGPLTDLCATVRIVHCEPGATVELRSLTRPDKTLISQVANAPEGSFDLDPGESLQVGDRLVARQETRSAESLETSPGLAEVVKEAPIHGLNAVDIRGRLWECALHVFAVGAVPGATVEVIWSGVIHGSGVADCQGVARFGLDVGLPPASQVDVCQRIGNTQGPCLSRDVQHLPASVATLPPPVVRQPVVECEPVSIERVFEGSIVTLTRGSGREHRAGFDLSELQWPLSPALDARLDRWLTARQEFPHCDRPGEQSDPVPVGSAQRPPTPVVNPLCANSCRLHVEHLKPGAEVRITVGDAVYKTHASGVSDQFEVEPLPVGNVFVQQFLCGKASDVATGTVDPMPAQLPAPRVVEPMECAHAVSVEGLYTGAVVQIWARDVGSHEYGPISRQLIATRPSIRIPVAPWLRADQEVIAKEWACGSAPLTSECRKVQPRRPIEDPVIQQPVTRVDTHATILETTQDAIVDVLRRSDRDASPWQLVGTQPAGGSTTQVPLPDDLAAGQLLRVRQRICDQQSPGARTVPVVKPRPLMPELQTPPDGYVARPGTEVMFAWFDPGVNQDREADYFTIRVIRSGIQVLELSTNSTTATLPAAETKDAGEGYSWSVEAANSTGTAASDTRRFTTPPLPHSHFVPGGTGVTTTRSDGGTGSKPVLQAEQSSQTIKITGYNFASNHQVEVLIRTYYSAIHGSPYHPVQVVDNREGTHVCASDKDGKVASVIYPSAVLEKRVENGVSYASNPYPDAEVKLTAWNKGSPANKSDEAFIKWMEPEPKPAPKAS